MAKSIIRIISMMISHIFRRGHGVFKILFVIDDFIRLFTMTIIIPYVFSLISSSKLLIYSGILLGMIIDVHDFVTEFSEGKIKR
ncbi:hypothetical protein GF327_07245 [Candidatus Woesearchaeota archaeon]|nr:hypothetical protein [Candidatus Woesearchaeota archaeon]